MSDRAAIDRWKRWLSAPSDPAIIKERAAYIEKVNAEHDTDAKAALAEFERLHPKPPPPEPSPKRATIDAWKDAFRTRQVGR